MQQLIGSGWWSRSGGIADACEHTRDRPCMTMCLVQANLAVGILGPDLGLSRMFKAHHPGFRSPSGWYWYESEGASA